MTAITPPTALRLLTRACLGLAMLAGVGCATGTGLATVSYDYFGTPDTRDPWTPKIMGWQSRERATGADASLKAPASVSGPGTTVGRPRRDALRSKYVAYRNDRKREMARELSVWIQREAKQHYVPDGPIDHWATFEETLSQNGDDCDGLELLAYHFLLDLGFGEDEVFRAIVVRPSDGQHHMVTLWFEQAEDPWVIDPTGAMTTRMVRMSERRDWVPLKVFSETEEFTVERRRRRAVHVTQR